MRHTQLFRDYGKERAIDATKANDTAYMNKLRAFIVTLRAETRAAQCANDATVICFILGGLLGAEEEHKLLISTTTWEEEYNKVYHAEPTVERPIVDVAHIVFARAYSLNGLLDREEEEDALKEAADRLVRTYTPVKEILSKVLGMALTIDKPRVYLVVLSRL